MAKHISRLIVKNWIGVQDFALEPGKVNTFKGPKGSGKTSIIEAMEAGLTNKRRRTEVVRHGEAEAILFLEADDGLSVERRIRQDGTSDYLKVRKPGQAVPSTEGFLRRFTNGEIFRPTDFIQKSVKEQIKVILHLIEIPWTMEDIQNWFGEIPHIGYEGQHILQVLRQIEAHYYEQREAVNREIKVLEAQVAGIRADLPPNYQGDEWRAINVRELDAQVAELTEKNRQIERAQELVTGLAEKIHAIKEKTESDKAAKVAEFKQKRSEGQQYIGWLKSKIEPCQVRIDESDAKIEAEFNRLDLAMEREIKEIKDRYDREKEEVRRQEGDIVRQQETNINSFQRNVAAKEAEIAGLDTLETVALESLDQQEAEKIKTAEAEAGNANELAGQEIGDIAPLKARADHVSAMREYLHEWDKMNAVIREQLAPHQKMSKTLTARIEKARELPRQLLQTTAVPVPGIEVDPQGNIRVNGTLIDGLSEGEQLELAFAVAYAQAGDLKVICLDGLAKINPAARAWIEERMAKDEYQYFITSTENGEFEVEIKEAAN